MLMMTMMMTMMMIDDDDVESWNGTAESPPSNVAWTAVSSERWRM
jgi:hypothetical protein